MSEYRSPLKDIRFTLNHICDLPNIISLPGVKANDQETVDAALNGASRLAQEVLAPLNHSGDKQGLSLENGVVRTPDGFAAAYRDYCRDGWNSLPFNTAYGGMGFPSLIGNVCSEIWNSANTGFALCPLLTYGAVEAIEAHGTDHQRNTFLPKMISGEWTGTMNLTEPQAGSDVGALATKAIPAGDGSWRITGQKIFITYGEHDFTENIIHLVLARTPGSPPGTRGISLFIVPKILLNKDGALGDRNDLRCVSLERKLGIHATPTCVMSYGDNGGAVGYMLGQENQGMRCMFTMMNNARLGIGIQGLAIAERAYQQAVEYSIQRRQGRAIGSTSKESSIIIEHADVRRMLMTMKSYIEAMRAICYANAEALDVAKHDPDIDRKERAAQLAELLTPISKGWCTDIACEVTSLGVQVHGGMGFIEETGAAQHFRDARITPIYEGTNGIQAMDLVMRKLPMAGGGVVKDFLDQASILAKNLNSENKSLARIATNLNLAVDATREAGESILRLTSTDPNAGAAGCTPYLQMFGLTAGGYYLALGAKAANRLLESGTGDDVYLESRIATACFFSEQVLPRVTGFLPAAIAGSDLLYAISAEDFAL